MHVHFYFWGLQNHTQSSVSVNLAIDIEEKTGLSLTISNTSVNGKSMCLVAKMIPVGIGVTGVLESSRLLLFLCLLQ
ncbi:hypothetical protein R6Q59_015019 [Mikania micrantha]